MQRYYKAHKRASTARIRTYSTGGSETFPGIPRACRHGYVILLHNVTNVKHRQEPESALITLSESIRQFMLGFVACIAEGE